MEGDIPTAGNPRFPQAAAGLMIEVELRSNFAGNVETRRKPAITAGGGMFYERSDIKMRETRKSAGPCGKSTKSVPECGSGCQMRLQKF